MRKSCECGKEFETKDKRQKYCSKECYKKTAWNKGLPKEQQPHFGRHHSEKVKNKISLGNKGKKKYEITKEIREKMSISRKGKLISKKPRELVCEFCHKEFKVSYPSRTKVRKFCSIKCQGLSKIGKNNEELFGLEKAKYISEKHRNRMIGEKNPMKKEETRKKNSSTQQGIPIEKWKKFISFEPYTREFTPSFKLAIKQRDGFMCLKCGMREEDHVKLFGRRESIHHIDSIKENTFFENCCVLCLRCNNEVNKDRENWKRHFQSLLSERYGYKYSENGEIILNLENKDETNLR